MRSIVEVVQNLIKPYIDSVKQALTTQENNITDVQRTGTSNSGTLIPKGKYFYLDGELKRATSDIANGVTFTSSNTSSGKIGDMLQHNANGGAVGYYASRTFQTNELDNVTSGSLKIVNSNGVITITTNNIVCTPNTVVKNISGFVGSGCYLYDENGGSKMIIDNSNLYFKEANMGYKALTFTL